MNISKRFCATALLLLIVATLVSGCGGSSKTVIQHSDENTDLRKLLGVPEHFPLPPIPDYNRPTAAKIDLGRHLFYDKRLSANATQACADCHLQELAFSDGEITSIGSTGDVLTRNSQGLGNAMYHATLTWASDAFIDLEQQLQVPIRSDNPVELGVTEAHASEVLARFDLDPLYVEKFDAAFPGANSGATINKIIQALASFCRTLITGSSAYDNYLQGDATALSEQQIRGLQLFNGEKFECFHCHSGLNFSTSFASNNSPQDTQISPFFNTGLYNIDNTGDYPAIDQGLFELTQKKHHRGLFRPQSLRNVALTAPYMHDGSIATLREVIEHYARGGRLIERGPFAGDGKNSPLKSGLIRGFEASEEEMQAVVSFLESLTDYEFINNPAHANPFDQ
ncbi:MAG TPA: MbnH family di-heme enzyme [Marinagarivorans sp.]